MRTAALCVVTTLLIEVADAWTPPRAAIRGVQRGHGNNKSCDGEMDLESLKQELTEYLAKRDTLSADDKAKETVGKQIGGTRGNPILEFVSGAPNKGLVIENAPNAFDYDELIKYGYSHLAVPIMKAGGRFAMYALLEMEAPSITSKPKPVAAPKFDIDRTGVTDKARYSGLKLGQVLDDNMQGVVLQEAQRKSKSGEALRPKLVEESFDRPFSYYRRLGPAVQTDWTPERLDELGRKQGEVMMWAKRARENQVVRDPFENIDLEPMQKVYSVMTAVTASLAYGRSTPVLGDWFGIDIPTDILSAPATALVFAALGSMIYSGIQARNLDRNQFVWIFKGLLGGPLTILQLRGLSRLLSEAESKALTDK